MRRQRILHQRNHIPYVLPEESFGCVRHTDDTRHRPIQTTYSSGTGRNGAIRGNRTRRPADPTLQRTDEEYAARRARGGTTAAGWGSGERVESAQGDSGESSRTGCTARSANHCTLYSSPLGNTGTEGRTEHYAKAGTRRRPRQRSTPRHGPCADDAQHTRAAPLLRTARHTGLRQHPTASPQRHSKHRLRGGESHVQVYRRRKYLQGGTLLDGTGTHRSHIYNR